MIRSVVEKLKIYAKFQSHEDITNFDLLLSDMSRKLDEYNFKIILSVLDDQTEYAEVMFGVVHALEFYSKEVYIDYLLRCAPDSFRTSPKWLALILNRVFNDFESSKLFSDKAKVEKNQIWINIFDMVANEYPHHKEFCFILKRSLCIPSV